MKLQYFVAWLPAFRYAVKKNTRCVYLIFFYIDSSKLSSVAIEV